jgi:ribose 1,5-bisphosphokinase PhnN
MAATLVVIVNGASGAGKSWFIGRMEERARELPALRGLRYACRSTTRAPRDRESLPSENRYLDPIVFEREAVSGGLDVHWRRTISSGREIRYGFGVAGEIAQGGVVVLSANNYLDWTAQPVLAELRQAERLVVVRVWASRATRRARLSARRPRLGASELSSRLDDVPADALPPVDYVVLNDPPFEAHVESDLLRWLAAVHRRSRRRPVTDAAAPIPAAAT